MEVSTGFIASTALDYDVAEYIIKAIAKKSVSYGDLYVRLESHILERT